MADKHEFWWDPKQPNQSSLWESKIRLGEAFFQEIICCPVPLNMNTLKALKRCSLGLDLYLWLTYRTFALTRPLRLSWRQVYRQFGADPAKASDANTVQMFRRNALRELKKIKLAWPGLNYGTAKGRASPLALEARDPFGRAAGVSELTSESPLTPQASPLTALRRGRLPKGECLRR